jgi:hypothetical protein
MNLNGIQRSKIPPAVALTAAEKGLVRLLHRWLLVSTGAPVHIDIHTVSCVVGVHRSLLLHVLLGGLLHWLGIP